MYGLIDSGADITIIGGSLLKRVAALAHLKKRALKKQTRFLEHTCTVIKHFIWMG